MIEAMMTEDELEKELPYRPPQTEHMKHVGPGRVLLVEDCEHTRAMIAHMLEGHGLEVITAADGEEFVEHALGSENQGNPFDLVLLDINLPRMDGVTATKMLRKSGYERPIIAITADPSLQERNASIFAGCDAFLAKSEMHLTLGVMLKQYL